MIAALLLAAGLQAASHPHDPWVFRSVLDGRPRSVTMAFSKDLWVAWDATECRVVQAWKGTVKFDGAVYTTEHGPQPTSEGWPYFVNLDAGFVLQENERHVRGATRFLGYAVEGDRVTFRYELAFEGERRMTVAETLSASPPDGKNRLYLEQAFVVSGIDGDACQLWQVRDPAGSMERGAQWNGRRVNPLAREGATDLALSFPPDGRGTLRTFLQPIDDDQLALYLAQREAAQDEADAEEAQAEGPTGLAPLPDGHATRQDPVHGPLRSGIALQVWDVGLELDLVPELVAGQTPNVSVVMPRLDLSDERDEFGGLQDLFVTVAEGFLDVPSAGTWTLRLTSDDGALLWLDGALALDHDGLHGPEPLDVELELASGLHPIRIRHFESGGGATLQLAWKGPGDAGFAVVPDAAFFCTAGAVRVTSPGPKKIIRPLAKGSPGDGRPLEGVHPSFELASARPEAFHPRVGGMDFLSDGRLAVCTWDADGAVYLLKGVRGDDPEAIEVQRFAAGLAEPLGLCVVDDRIFVLQKQELTELVDHDGDGRADEYRCVSAGWGVSPNFHEFAFGLAYADGRFFGNLAIAIDPGGASTKVQHHDRGSTIAIDPQTGEYEIVARGLRTPNGIGKGAGGTIFLTDNQGDWVPVSKLLRLAEGAFYGNRSVLTEAELQGLVDAPPVCWLPQGEIGNSPSQPALLPDGFGPYSGQMVHGEVTHGGLKRTFVEEIDGVWQGCVFRFTQGLEAGINRLALGEPGEIFVGGIGSTGNWGQAGKRGYGLQRLRYTGPPAFEMLAVRAKSNGLELELTEPLAEGSGWEALGYVVTQYRYEATSEYGGPKLDEEPLTIRSASPSADRRRVFLELAGLRPGHVLHVRLALPLESETGRRPWTTEAWYTLNRIPADRPGEVRAAPPAPPANVLTEAERAAGWRLLFDGESTTGWRGFRQAGPPEGWAVVDGCLARVGPGGDLVTEEEFEDFELSLEWRISRGGNSGIFFHVAPEGSYVWETGPEMQVLDDDEHPDGRSPLTSAGANYALDAPVRDVTRPIGLFNEARIVVDHGHVEHWLNGVKLLEYELGGAEWERKVAASKFASMARYGRAPRGHIALQDHGDPVWFRNVKIREL